MTFWTGSKLRLQEKICTEVLMQLAFLQTMQALVYVDWQTWAGTGKGKKSLFGDKSFLTSLREQKK